MFVIAALTVERVPKSQPATGGGMLVHDSLSALVAEIARTPSFHSARMSRKSPRSPTVRRCWVRDVGESARVGSDGADSRTMARMVTACYMECMIRASSFRWGREETGDMLGSIGGGGVVPLAQGE